jgi:hypothetical protein
MTFMEKIDLESFLLTTNEILVRLLKHCDEFSQADAVAGDGDLGLNVNRACTALLKEPKDGAPYDFRKWFTYAGDTINEAAPSSFMTLVSKGLRKTGQKLPESDSVDVKEVVAAAAFGVAHIGKIAGAQVGDKTMMDALVPAIESLQDSAMTNVLEDISHAAERAVDGTKSTAAMVSKKGRARWNPEKTIGHIDAGALVISTFFELMSRVGKERGDSR